MLAHAPIMHKEIDKAMGSVTILFSSPGDVGKEKARLIAVVEEMRPAFLRHGVSLAAWTFENDTVPLAAAGGNSVQTVIDQQMPRKPDGSIAYDLFVGIMDRRIGTPLKDAVSGTVHEFVEAKNTFESTGRPHILFYFRDRQPETGQAESQMEGVQRFRSQYPGLFARYRSIGDLETQFRRHLLAELLDLCSPTQPEEPQPTTAEWWDGLRDRYMASRAGSSVTYLDRTPEKVCRIIRQLHLLLGVGHSLSARENQLLTTSLFAGLLRQTDPDRAESFAGYLPDSAQEIREVLARSEDLSRLGTRPVGQTRLDLLGALVKIGWRLDLSRQGISVGIEGPPDASVGAADEWLAYLTDDVVCERGVVRPHLLAPSERWVKPLIGATAIVMEGLWQQVRAVLTKYGLSFAVGRCRVEADAEVGSIPENVLDLISECAQHAIESLPALPHFGEARLPDLGELLPLPLSKVDSAVLFRAPNPGPVRLLVDGVIIVEDEESGTVEYEPPAGKLVECVLECDEGGEFVPVIHSRLQRLSPAEAGILDFATNKADAFRSLGMWNRSLEMIWPRIAGPRANREDLTGAFHTLRNAFEELPQSHAALLVRRDLYWDAMEIVRNRIVREET